MHGNIHFGLGNRGLRSRLLINSPSTRSVAPCGTALDCSVARAPRNDGLDKEQRANFGLVPRTQCSRVAHCSASGPQETCREIPLPAAAIGSVFFSKSAGFVKYAINLRSYNEKPPVEGR